MTLPLSVSRRRTRRLIYHILVMILGSFVMAIWLLSWITPS